MRATRTDDTALIVAAQAGDRQALGELAVSYLPLVYTIVRRALGGHPDVDDIVQDIMLRVVRQLPELRSPDSFRPWLAAIAVRQISTHVHRRHALAARTADLDEAAEAPDPDADVEALTMLRTDLSRQRRQATRAGEWLDAGDRALLSLWWLESADQLSRSEVAAALGVSTAHAGVRVKRMRAQLELSRSIVAALESSPRCTGLDAVVSGWDGNPGPLWRKRIARHIRSCRTCAAAADGLVAAERLLVGAALLPVPAALTVSLTGNGGPTAAAVGAAPTTAAVSGQAGAAVTGVGGKVGLIGHLVQAVGAHPVVAAVAAGAIVAGAAVTPTVWRAPEPSSPTAIAAPTDPPAAGQPTGRPPRPSAGTLPARALPPGPVSLESVNASGLFVATWQFLGVLTPVGPDAPGAAREQATVEVVPGLADPGCVSLRTRDGWYLRHSSWRLRTSLDQDSELFRADATFCVRAGSVDGSVSLESFNYPGWFLHRRGVELWVDRSTGDSAFHADGSFVVRPPLAG